LSNAVDANGTTDKADDNGMDRVPVRNRKLRRQRRRTPFAADATADYDHDYDNDYEPARLVFPYGQPL